MIPQYITQCSKQTRRWLILPVLAELKVLTDREIHGIAITRYHSHTDIFVYTQVSMVRCLSELLVNQWESPLGDQLHMHVALVECGVCNSSGHRAIWSVGSDTTLALSHFRWRDQYIDFPDQHLAATPATILLPWCHSRRIIICHATLLRQGAGFQRCKRRRDEQRGC